MSLKTQDEVTWSEEVAEHGLKETISNRLKFHGDLYLMFVVRFTGCVMTTTKKHLGR
jgi:hypothetical protein